MMVTGLVTIAGGIGLMMAIGSGTVAALKWFHNYDVDFSSKKRNEGYSGSYNRDEERRSHMNGMRRNNSSTTNIK